MTKEFDPTKPATTKSGYPVRIVDTKLKYGTCDEYNILAIITHPDGKESFDTFNSDGKYFADGSVSDWDLINTPEKHVRWMNVYHDGDIVYESRELADKWAMEHRIACIRVEFEEGDGL